MSAIGKQFLEFAKIYDELFSAICDYKKEVDFYHNILKKYKVKDILEVGCGCAHRADHFVNRGYTYQGFDISKPMLKLAHEKYPHIKLTQGDVRDIKMRKNYDAIVFLGKGSVYLTKNDDVIAALVSMKRRVRKGLIVIDAFNASYIIPNFKRNISWSKKLSDKTITRKSKNTLDLRTGWTWKREVRYIVKQKNTKQYHDKAILRSFTKDEMNIFFLRSGIKPLKFIEKGDTLISIGYTG